MNTMRSLVLLAAVVLPAALGGCVNHARQDLLLQAAQPSVAGLAALEEVLEENRERIYPTWQRAESDNFILFAPADGPMSGDLQGFLARREKAYQGILDHLASPPIGVMTIYAYNSSRQGQKLLGRPLSFALPARREIHIRWDQEPGHEEAHLVAWSWNQRGCGEPFLEEGLAVALSSHPGSPQATASELLARGVLPDLGDLIRRFQHHRNGYALAGSFIALLLENSGSTTVRDLYIGGPGNFSARLEEITGQSLDELQTWWETTLAATEPATREPIVEALSLLQVGRVQEAIDLLERQRRDMPDSPVLEFALAQARGQHGDTQGSLDSYRRVLAMPLPYHLAWMKQRAGEALREAGEPLSP
jgi:outer membrane murein-binding lipoprotein Lpp